MDTSIDSPQVYWFEAPGAVGQQFYGVFEGGGAKGIAYTGALLAMKEKQCWFRSVAGASAGAITAALIAAGLAPEEIDADTEAALHLVRTGAWEGLRRLRSETGYFPVTALRSWLDEKFRTQVAKKRPIEDQERITFRALFDATGIELNVVAADLSLRRLVVFSHHETPACAVADAVVASSSIPFAFPSSVLQVPEGDPQKPIVLHHTIVDGGVWSNFPIFIFEDPAFREVYARAPVAVPAVQVLGFLLHEADPPDPPRGEDVLFRTGRVIQDFRAREWMPGSSAEPTPPSLAAKAGAWLLYPFHLLGRFVDWNSGMERGRWPEPRSLLARNLVSTLNGLLGGIHPYLLGLLAWIVVLVGAWQVIAYLGADQLRAIQVTDWSSAGEILARLFSITITALGIAVTTLIAFAGLVGVAANFTLLRVLRRILFGLVSTYVAGPGAPDWLLRKANIIPLPIPPEVGTLTFDMPPHTRQDLIETARQATLQKLEGILVEGNLAKV